MTQGNSAAVDVYAVRADTKALGRDKSHRCERFVDLDQIEVAGIDALALADRQDRIRRLLVQARVGPRDYRPRSDLRQPGHTEVDRGRSAGDDNGAGAV